MNRKDPQGKNVFEGGFLGLDNIGVFDRSAPLPTGGSLEQADGTAWMAFYAQNMLEIALVLADHDPVYEEIAFKFLEHFLWIADAMDQIGEHRDDMWDEEDGFFYDVLRLPDGEASRLKVRSMVGLLPLCAAHGVRAGHGDAPPAAAGADRAASRSATPSWSPTWRRPRRVHRPRRAPPARPSSTRRSCERVLGYLLDENEFLSPYGIRSLSRYHREHPYVFHGGGPGVPRRATCRPSRTPACSAATRTGAGRSGCRSTS